MAFFISQHDANDLVRWIETTKPLYWKADTLRQQNAMLGLARLANKIKRKSKTNNNE